MPNFREVAFKLLEEKARISQAGRKKASLESHAPLKWVGWSFTLLPSSLGQTQALCMRC